MATPKLWSGILIDGKVSKLTGKMIRFYLPILESTPEIKLLWKKDLPPEIRDVFRLTNYENYNELWEALIYLSANDHLILLNILNKIIKISR
jgi:hypothetical protein